MPKANSVHSTPWLNAPTVTTIARKRAAEAVPAIAHEPPWRLPPSHRARLAGSPNAVLMRLREEAAAEIDRLLAFLDATEGDLDSDECCEDEGAENDVSGCGDYEGLLEQVGTRDWQQGAMA